MPEVSIITPVYNAARWLQETLHTAQQQTFTDWEHIFVDDGSTDDSVQILQAASAKEPRIRVILEGNRQGPSAARNLAISHAQGRYIAFLDADDLWHPTKLERSVDWMKRHNYAFIYHDYRHISYDGSQVGALIRGPEVLDERTLHTRRGTGGCLSVVIDREQIPDFQFPRKFKMTHEDFCGWLSILQKGHLGHRLPVDLGRYRLSPHSRSSNKLRGIGHSWIIYREISKLPRLRAAYWWSLYVWNTFWLYQYARPRKAF